MFVESNRMDVWLVVLFCCDVGLEFGGLIEGVEGDWEDCWEVDWVDWPEETLVGKGWDCWEVGSVMVVDCVCWRWGGCVAIVVGI